jgi:hypothetical protein
MAKRTKVVHRRSGRAGTSSIQSLKRQLKAHAARKAVRLHKPRLQFEWVQAITPAQWNLYRAAIHAIRDSGIPFVLGGGFALATYTGRWRNTKDIDFYILRRDRQKAIDALTDAGFTDLYSQQPYDRKWIYRSIRLGVIVDIIWAMANQRAQVDEHWFHGAPPVSIRGEPLSVVPMEEFLWCKLYIMQRDHCDWTDVLNLLFAAGEEMDWAHLLSRLDDDWPLLKAVLTLYGWLCPKRASQLPQALRDKLRLDTPVIPRRMRRNRIRLLDTRAWFAALLPKNKPLEV